MAGSTVDGGGQGERPDVAAPVADPAPGGDRRSHYEFEHRSGYLWRVVGGLVQALLVVLVAIVAISSVVRF